MKLKYEPYPDYKKSEVGWCDALPNSWGHVNLRWAASIYAGGTPSKKVTEFWEYGTVPWINSGAVNQRIVREPSTMISDAALANSSAKWIPNGSLVLALAGQGKTKGMVAQLGISTTCNQSMAAIVPTVKLRPRYLFWWLTTNYQNIRNMAGGDLRDGLNLELLGDIECPIPSSEEQKQIASFLDYETAKIDALIEKQQQLIALLGEKRQAVISHAVTKGLNPEAPMQDSGVEWLGKLPSHWEVKKFKHLLQMIVDNRGRTPPFGDDGVPMLEATQITGGTRYPLDNFVKFVPREIVDKFERDKVQEGDVLMTTVGATAGRAVLVDTEPLYFIAQNVIGMRPKQDVESDFLFYLVTSDFFYDSLFMLNKSSTIDNLKVSVFVNIQCPLPPRKEQRDVVKRLNEQTKSGLQLEAKAVQVIELLQERRTALISAAVTGKIDVRDWKRPSADSQLETETEVA